MKNALKNALKNVEEQLSKAYDVVAILFVLASALYVTGCFAYAAYQVWTLTAKLILQ